ncbi:hypothetical protein EZV62_027641 [Acer yangbiense]|uniref:choline-phosphate cytidylyltransferase n=1 Tax=Acer yangbiense TaxID=1000413 RepID=A0A5C7GV59_9ROSI|nr:hypothetical protein EZV62_027641 [Acer yangbiense]
MKEFLDKHQIDYVAHDALPYADTSGAGKDVYEFVKTIGKFKETKRTDGISTSDIIMRIVKDYNQYVMRNLDRGYSIKELGVSYVKACSVSYATLEKWLRMNMGLKKLHEKVKKQQEKVGEKGTAIRERIQERLKGQPLIGFIHDKDDDDDDYFYDDDTDGKETYDDDG